MTTPALAAQDDRSQMEALALTLVQTHGPDVLRAVHELGKHDTEDKAGYWLQIEDMCEAML